MNYDVGLVFNKVKCMNDIEDITESEANEYLAYHNYQDVLNNYEFGMQALKQFDFSKYQGTSVLICGAMVAFDKGLSAFLNKWYENDNTLFLLSEVTAEYRRYTKERVHMPFICTPHLLAKEIIVIGMDIPVAREARQLFKKKTYIREAVYNLEERHIKIGDGYAIMWAFYSYQYINILLDGIMPKSVVLWNEFYAFHHIFKGICIDRGIHVSYIEFGCIPGTICVEENGQQGESIPARHASRIIKALVEEDDITNAKRVLKYLKYTGLNRNVQPKIEFESLKCMYYSSQRKTVLYLGQNDYESGISPYTMRSKKYHSPIFSSTLEALEHLRLLALKNGWNLIFKPHPIMVTLGHCLPTNGENVDVVDNVDINCIIDAADVIVTILSQGAYISLIREKPVVMLGYNQLKGKKCTYEAFHKYCIEKRIKEAIMYGYTELQRKEFEKHVAWLLRYYLYDDGVERELRFGKDVCDIKKI